MSTLGLGLFQISIHINTILKTTGEFLKVFFKEALVKVENFIKCLSGYLQNG